MARTFPSSPTNGVIPLPELLSKHQRAIFIGALCFTGCEEQERNVEPQEATEFAQEWSKLSCKKSRACVVDFLDDVGKGARLPDDVLVYKDCWPTLSKRLSEQLEPCQAWLSSRAQTCLQGLKDAKCSRNILKKPPACDELFDRCEINWPGTR